MVAEEIIMIYYFPNFKLVRGFVEDFMTIIIHQEDIVMEKIVGAKCHQIQTFFHGIITGVLNITRLILAQVHL